MKAKLNQAGRHLKFSFHPSGINAAKSSFTSHTPTSQSCFPFWVSAAHAGLLASLSAGGWQDTWHLQGLPRPEEGARRRCSASLPARSQAWLQSLLFPKGTGFGTTCVQVRQVLVRAGGGGGDEGGRRRSVYTIFSLHLAVLSAPGQKFVHGSVRSSYDICKTLSTFKPDFQEEDLLGSKSSDRSQRGCKFLYLYGTVSTLTFASL